MRTEKLDVSLYEEVEADKEAMGQAMTFVILSSVAAGIGTIGAIGIKGFFLGTIAALVGWFIWAYLTYAIGTKLLAEPQTKADYGECYVVRAYSTAASAWIRVVSNKGMELSLSFTSRPISRSPYIPESHLLLRLLLDV